MSLIRVPSIAFTTYIDVLPDQVYAILTSSKGWDTWFTYRTRIDPQAGGQIQFYWKDFGPYHLTLRANGIVLEAEPNRKLMFQWIVASVPTTVTIMLEELEGGTLVKLTEEGHTATDQDLAVLIDSAAGWGEALTRLKYYLEYGVTYGVVPHAVGAKPSLTDQRVFKRVVVV
ncbi:MAG TPA: SRPBCC domain-containing protein [Herpetosiphonaceae bacterium]